MNARRTLVYFHTFSRSYLRNPLGLFFALVFPIILILIFGGVFSSSGSAAVPFYVQNMDHSSPASQQFLSALNKTGVVSITMVDPSAGNLSSYLAKNSYTAGMVIPAGFGSRYVNRTPDSVIVYTNPSAGASSSIVQGAVLGVSNSFNLQAANGTQIISPADLQVGSQVYTYIDYLIPGLIGFSILTSPMFSLVNISSEWKKEKLFRQLSLTPLTKSEWLVAALLWYIVLTLITTVLMLVVGRLLFGAHVTFNLLILPFLLLGPMFFVSLGLLAGSVSTKPETAAVIGNVITFPMMFLSGTFFPVSSFPSWLMVFAHVLPLYYVIDGMNAAMLFDNPGRVLFDSAVILVLAVVFFIAAVRVFSWKER
ncbi:MAG: ABC transporter permease [Thermoplasmata archaeon]